MGTWEGSLLNWKKGLKRLALRREYQYYLDSISPCQNTQKTENQKYIIINILP
jgi:hypothetical protein